MDDSEKADAAALLASAQAEANRIVADAKVKADTMIAEAANFKLKVDARTA